jgi:glycerophosphoryl diester phosphodiesterase
MRVPERLARVIAHRGASRDCPENTLAAFDEALRQGADGIELDVQLSRDGVPVVHHDRTLARAGGGRRRVAQLDVAELASLDPGSRVERRFRGERLPTLEAVLDRFGGRTLLLIEIKTREGRGGGARHERLARAVARLVRERKLERHTLALSFDLDALAACADEAPRLGALLNLDPPRRLGSTLRESLGWLHGLSADVRGLTPGFGAELRSAGRPLYVYTCNTERAVARALAAGAAGIMSDRPAWLAGLLGPDGAAREA